MIAQSGDTIFGGRVLRDYAETPARSSRQYIAPPGRDGLGDVAVGSPVLPFKTGTHET
jgi:hypothetical protein